MKVYSIRGINYRFFVPAVNIRTRLRIEPSKQGPVEDATLRCMCARAHSPPVSRFCVSLAVSASYYSVMRRMANATSRTRTNLGEDRVRGRREFKDDVIPRSAAMNIPICIQVLKWPDYGNLCVYTYTREFESQ